MLFHAKNNTAKWKGRNLFSYSVSGTSQVISTKRVLALVRVIQKNGRTELPTEKDTVRQRPEEKSCPKIREGKKCGPEIWTATRPQAQRRFYGTLQVNRNRPLLK